MLKLVRKLFIVGLLGLSLAFIGIQTAQAGGSHYYQVNIPSIGTDYTGSETKSNNYDPHITNNGWASSATIKARIMDEDMTQDLSYKETVNKNNTTEFDWLGSATTNVRTVFWSPFGGSASFNGDFYPNG